jgi:7-cyano-7-deazaguanine synthase
LNKAIILVSGGLDSCVTAATAHDAGFNLAFLHLDYGQRTEVRELKAFTDIVDFYSVSEVLSVRMSHLVEIGGSCLTDTNIEVPKANLDNSDIPISYVPFRNANMISVAVSWAEVIGASHIFIGAVEEDSSGYPDCRRDFFDAFEKLIIQGTRPETSIKLETPLIHLDKSQIIKKGVSLKAPLHLTWSCYQAENIPCGDCDSCALRARGFEKAGIIDPILDLA